MTAAGVGLRVTVDDGPLGDALARLGQALADPRPLWDELAGALETSTDQRFEHERGPDGTPWTQSLRAKLHDGKTLTDHGILRDSVTRNVGPDFLEVGSNLIYARIHQMGGVIRPVNAKVLSFTLADGTHVLADQVVMPARPYLGLSADDRDEIGEIVVAWIDRVLGGRDA